ncbi:myb-related transcription factor, partner of profilin [Denticeps clupeoides]|uniref:Myb/SANT-like DNA-binding domain-containing protein n=1 Tax=Denticeps clupeoides TaxID=299321 RepID=A0AAY4EG34_9TELE|nr:myb-related transcription factor, partner of profilin-like [Denticeps clupeoides]XP_028818931.1 myb-related transcription factor, partner of profilin-like [Denticeps clupeoides]
MSGYPYARSGRGGGTVRFKRRKSRFSFEEVKLMLSEVKRNRHILVGKFNRGVCSDVKKRTWAAITARVNEISECPREILEIIKKWSDLKCDTKRKVAAMRASGASTARIARDLSAVESMVHNILQMPVPSNDFGAPSVDNHGDDDSVGAPVPQNPSGVTNGRMLLRPSVAPGSADASLTTAMPEESLSVPKDVFKRSSPCHVPDFHFESSDVDEPGMKFTEGPQEGVHRDPSRAISHQVTNGTSVGSAVTKTPSTSLPPMSRPASSPPSHQPAFKDPRLGTLQEQLAHNSSLSLQEQQATTQLVGSLSRSLESLSESVQHLVETQQDFVRNSLQLQRDTLHMLRDFTSSALTILQDKLNGHP